MSKLTKRDNNKQIKKIIYIGLVIIWMAVVFIFSNQPSDESSVTSSGVAEIITEVLSNVSIIGEEQKAEMVETLNPIVRKFAHYSIYTLGGILIINYINTYKINEQKKMIYSIAIGAIYAMSDELHQIFVEGRSAQITDVVLDTIGMATGVCIFLVRCKDCAKNKK